MDVSDRNMRSWCENEGVRWRKELKLYAYSPLPARLLAQHLKTQVFSPIEIPEVDKTALECLLAEDAGWSALTLPIGEGRHWIIYNPTHAPTRTESDLMHELAHLLLGHHPIRFHQLANGLLTREYRAADEEAAAYLGGCLQITDRGLDWAFQRDMTLQEMAEHFGASLQMVRFRCNMTGHNKYL